MLVDHWEPVSREDRWEAVRQAKGSAGVDGWDGLEVKHLPLPAIEIFHQCTLRWYESGCLPDQMSESKQVCIPKINKISDNNTLKVQDVRLSAFFRFFGESIPAHGSSLIRLKNGLNDICMTKLRVGKGLRGPRNLLIELLQSHFASHRKGYLTSLDWSQAFDRMRPAVSIQVLQELNFAPRFIPLLHGAWIQQKRFLMFDGMISPHLLPSKRAMPQCDPRIVR